MAEVLSIIALCAVSALIPLGMWMRSEQNRMITDHAAHLSELIERVKKLESRNASPAEERLTAVEQKLTAIQMQRSARG